LNEPTGVAVAPDGSLYIADFHNGRVRRVSPGGIITTVAGDDSDGPSGDDGPATAANLSPFGVAVGEDGSIYISDPIDDRVRRVNPSGIITTVAGDEQLGDSGDNGPATQAELNEPSGVALGRDGSVYVSGQVEVRRVSPAGTITTVAGDGTLGSGG
jgi:glucose/arabinose dehydrogenase